MTSKRRKNLWWNRFFIHRFDGPWLIRPHFHRDPDCCVWRVNVGHVTFGVHVR